MIIWQKPTQYSKAIMIQLKVNKPTNNNNNLKRKKWMAEWLYKSPSINSTPSMVEYGQASNYISNLNSLFPSS